VPDIYHGNFAASVQHLIDHAIITGADAVKVFCTGKFVCIVRNWFTHKILNMLKNVRDNFFGDLPEIFFSALLTAKNSSEFFSSSRFLRTFQKCERIHLHVPGSHHAFLQLGKTYRTFVPPLGNHGEIMEIFLEMLIFCEREDDGDLVPVLIDNILFGGGHTGFLIIHCIRLMI
jgi:hypothetical protein